MCDGKLVTTSLGADLGVLWEKAKERLFRTRNLSFRERNAVQEPDDTLRNGPQVVWQVRSECHSPNWTTPLNVVGPLKVSFENKAT